MSKRNVWIAVAAVAVSCFLFTPAAFSLSAASSGPVGTIRTTTFLNLGAPTNGNLRYCINCSATAPCTGGGTGAFAYRTAGAWNCTTGGSGGSAPFSDAAAIVKNSADATKLFKIDASGITTANTVTLSAGGTAAAPTLTFAGSILPGGITMPTTGSATAPSLTFSGATNSGLYRQDANSWAITATGVRIGDFYNGYARWDKTSTWGSNAYVCFNNGTNPDTGGEDACLQRSASGVLSVHNGATSSGSAGSLRATYTETVVGGNVASAATITPTGGIFHVTGTTAIATINLPRTGFTGCIQIIPDAAFTTTTAGNIALASTAVVKKVLIECFDGTSWFPSY